MTTGALTLAALAAAAKAKTIAAAATDEVAVVSATLNDVQVDVDSAQAAATGAETAAQQAIGAAEAAELSVGVLDARVTTAEQDISTVETSVADAIQTANQAKSSADDSATLVGTLSTTVSDLDMSIGEVRTIAEANVGRLDAVELVAATAQAESTTALANATTAQTDASAALTATTTIANYKKELHIDPVNGDDANVGTAAKPVKTWEKLLTLIDGSGLRVVMHPGTYPENVTFNKLNVTIEGLVGQGALVNVTGDWSFSNSTSSVRAGGVAFTNVTQFGAGSLYMTNCAVRGTFAKTLSAYSEFKDCDLAGSGILVSAGGYTNIFRSKVINLSVNNGTAVVTALDCENLAFVSCTSGVLQLGRNIVFAPDGTTPAITGAAGSTVIMQDNKVYTPSGTNARIVLQGLYSVSGDQFDIVNSTLSGINLGTASQFDALQSKGSITAGGLLSGAAFAVPWALTNAYAAGVWVDKSGNLARSNAAIPANTAYATGTTGATWTEIGVPSSIVYSAYQKEIHVDPDGLDTNTGTAGRPFKTLDKARQVYTAGMRIVLHQGTYAGTTQFDTAVELEGVGSVSLSGTLTLNHAADTSSIKGLSVYTLNQSGAGAVTLDNVKTINTLAKTGAGLLKATDCDLRLLNITAAGQTYLTNTNTVDFLSNHASAITHITGGEHLDGRSFLGKVYKSDALLLSSTSNGNCFTAEFAASLVSLNNVRGFYKDASGNLTLARIVIRGGYQLIGSCYFAPDSTFTTLVQDGYTKAGDVVFDAAKVKSVAMSHDESSAYGEGVLVEWNGKLIKSNSAIASNTQVVIGTGANQWTVIAEPAANAGAKVTLRAGGFGAIVPNAKMGDHVIVTTDGTLAGQVLETWIHTEEYWLQTSGQNYTAASIVDNTNGDSQNLKIGRSIVPATNVDSLFDAHRNRYVDYDGRSWIFKSPANGDKVVITTGVNAGKIYSYDNANNPPWTQKKEVSADALEVIPFDSQRVGGYTAPCVVIEDNILYKVKQDIAQGGSVDQVNSDLLGAALEYGGESLATTIDIAAPGATDLLIFQIPSAGLWEVTYFVDALGIGSGITDTFNIYLASFENIAIPGTESGMNTSINANTRQTMTNTIRTQAIGGESYRLKVIEVEGSLRVYANSTKVLWKKVGGYTPFVQTPSATAVFNSTNTLATSGYVVWSDTRYNGFVSGGLSLNAAKNALTLTSGTYMVEWSAGHTTTGVSSSRLDVNGVEYRSSANYSTASCGGGSNASGVSNKYAVIDATQSAQVLSFTGVGPVGMQLKVTRL